MRAQSKYFLAVILASLVFLIIAAETGYVLKQLRSAVMKPEPLSLSSQLYFAYGSNMSLSNMSGRCGTGAKLIGPARLDGYELTFDHRGYANIIPQSGDYVWGVAWDIDQPCVTALDRYEGYPEMYGRQAVSIMIGQQTLEAFVYIEPVVESGGTPSRSYLDNRVIPGAKENGLPSYWVNKLRQY